MELSAAIHLLGDILGEVISELESPELFAIEERIRSAAKERRAGNVQAEKQLKAEVEALDVDAARAVSSASHPSQPQLRYLMRRSNLNAELVLC